MSNINNNELKENATKMIKTLKENESLFRLSDIAKIIGLPYSKIRYWDQCGYLPIEKNNNDKCLKYTTDTLMRAQIINTYLNKGFTLKTAVKKADNFKKYKGLTMSIVEKIFTNITFKDDGEKLLIDFGEIENYPGKHAYLKYENNDFKINIKD